MSDINNSKRPCFSPPSSSSGSSGLRPSLVCRFCNAVFTTVQSLLDHVDSHHPLRRHLAAVPDDSRPRKRKADDTSPVLQPPPPFSFAQSPASRRIGHSIHSFALSPPSTGRVSTQTAGLIQRCYNYYMASSFLSHQPGSSYPTAPYYRINDFKSANQQRQLLSALDERLRAPYTRPFLHRMERPWPPAGVVELDVEKEDEMEDLDLTLKL